MDENLARNNFEIALNQFEFSKVYNMMKAIHWTYWNSNGETPTQEMLMNAVKENFERALKYEGNCKSGGFKISIQKETSNVKVQFIGEEKDSYDYT